MITGKENLHDIATLQPELIPYFQRQALGGFFEPESLKKVGRFTRLETLLRAQGIDAPQFIKELNLRATHRPANTQPATKNYLHFMAMLPCGLRNPFKEYVNAYVLEHPELFEGLNYQMEGNVNHELSYYPMLESVDSVDELPDIILASDVNHFFHRPFMDKFVNSGNFTAYQPYPPNAYLEKEQYADPDNNFSMYTANMLVMVADKKRLDEKDIPSKWEELLAPKFKKNIVMRGEDDFFCNAVMLPFYKEHGFDAIRSLAKNIKAGMHPAEMVKLAGSGKAESAGIYIMPYFFAQRIKNKAVEVIWPSDGAIASPVFMLIKKDKVEQHKALLDFLYNKETGHMLNGRFFPSIHAELTNDAFPKAVKWLGWDFLKQHDIGALKDEIRKEFMDIWKPEEELAIK